MRQGSLAGRGTRRTFFRFALALLIIIGLAAGATSVVIASHPGTTVLVDSSDATPDAGGCGDAVNPCGSIQAAIDHANPGDTIQVAAGLYFENVIVDRSVSIAGAGASSTVVDGSGLDTVFTIFGGEVVELSGMTIQNGNGPFGGGILNGGSAVTLAHSAVQNNTASLIGGGIVNFIGGEMRIEGVTVSDNAADDIGGGIANLGISMVIINSTISGNTALAGGGIANLGFMSVHNATITDNSATDAGVINGGDLMLANTIIAAQSAGDDCLSEGVITSLGHNLDSDGTCELTGAGDMPGVAPMLWPLADNRGPTPTHLPKKGSPVIDTGDPLGCADDVGNPLAADQRGFRRHMDGGSGSARCDIGAVEIEQKVTSQLQLIGYQAPSPGQTPPGGIFPITATFRNVGGPLENLFFRTAILSYNDGVAPHPELSNRRAGTPPHEGSELDVALPAGVLNTGDTIQVTYQVMLPRIAAFTFFTDAHTILEP
ncbi:MAG: hypothetical protein L0177_05240 [Chloroflexi bacterium]|nr:hypothetical protein [Chloroflexota bacterium]